MGAEREGSSLVWLLTRPLSRPAIYLAKFVALLPWSPPGEGAIDWRHVVSALEQVGYAGAFMLEVAGNGDIAGHVLKAWAAAARIGEEPR